MRAVIVGDGPQRAALEAQRQALGLADRVILAGLQRDVAPWLAALDLLVLPSYAKIGIAAHVRVFDPATARDASAPALQLEATGIGADPDDVFSALFGPRADGAPAWGWRQPVVGDLLLKARAESDPTKRTELYKQVSKIVRLEVPRVPLLFVDRASAASRKVGGYAGGPTGTESFAMVFIRA